MSTIVSMHEGPDHLRPVHIRATVMQRWLETARWLAKEKAILLQEIGDLEHDAAPHRLRSA